MGILVQDNVKHSELQDKITADLREKAIRSSKDNDADLVNDAEYIKNLKKTSRFSWVWFTLVFLAVASVVIILVI